MKTRAFAIIPVLLVMAVVTAGAYLLKPSLFPGSSHRAAVSAGTTADLIQADKARASYAAASVVKIAEANGTAPESPVKAFISQESTLALAHLPAPDQTALIEAERRKNAVLSGQVDEARRLYEKADEKAAKLSKERDAAIAAKQASDTALIAAAAAEHAANVQRLAALGVAGLLFVLWGYAKIYGITPGTLGKVVYDINGGTNPIQALDTNLAPWLHAKVSRAAKLAG
ncbi:MAG TPA: hypothetical protein VL357_01625 [Rariglobus sp.]|nr:hypothetical protein [Rariglobus sp.]